MADKKSFFAIACVIVIVIVVMTQPVKQPDPSGQIIQVGQVATNQTATQNQPIIIQDYYGWIVAGLLILYLLWKHSQGSKKKGYKDYQEAFQHLTEVCKKAHLYPFNIVSGDFKTPENKIEFYGYIRPANEQLQIVGKPVPFCIRKNGYFRWDGTVLVAKQLPDRDTVVYKTLTESDKNTGHFKLWGGQDKKKDEEDEE